jgi:hypothetical protein
MRDILSASCVQSSLAVVEESARSVFVLPSMNVIGSMRGFFDLVACENIFDNIKQLPGYMFFKE